MLITIEVTDADIDSGTKSSSDCMVARALNKYIESPCGTIGYGSGYIFQPGRKAVKIVISVTATQKIRQFDYWKSSYGSRPEPFSFEIDIPAEYLKIEVPVLAEVVC